MGSRENVSGAGGRGASWLTSVIVAVVGCGLLAFAMFTVQQKQEPTKAPDNAAALRDAGLATTHTRTPKAPRDTHLSKATTGLVVHPNRTVGLYDKPGGKAFAKLNPQEFGDSWFPAIARAGEWLQIMLPSKPNGSTGWVRSGLMATGHTPYVIRVHLKKTQLELYKDRRLIGAWRVAVGAPGTPTPTGRTFVLGQFTDEAQSFSPVILPLGTHSATLDSFGGGPGTVAIHGWPKADTFGKAVSHGCIRVPTEALFQLRQVPVGTLVMIDNA
jgi:hypothetical protein